MVRARSRDWRVLIDVSPPLLRDVLADELARADVHAVVAGFADDRSGEGYDLVVTNGDPPRASARALLWLPSDGTGTAGSLITARGAERVEVDTADDVIRIVRSVCGGARSQAG